MLIQFIVAFFATISFAVIFSIPKKEYFFCGITGAIGWLFYLIFFHFSKSISLATLISTIALTIVSRLFAVNRRVPVTIFLISGIFPLVPGAGIYYTTYYIFADNLNLAAKNGVQTISIAISIAFGIILVFAIPQKLFHLGNLKTKS